MNDAEKKNWEKVRDALEAAGKTESYFYKRAVAICKGETDPLKLE